ncbi:unnamed protein product, partial [Brassica rapa subsp. narinosa]
MRQSLLLGNVGVSNNGEGTRKRLKISVLHFDNFALIKTYSKTSVGIGVGCFLFLISLSSIYFSFVVMFMGTDFFLCWSLILCNHNMMKYWTFYGGWDDWFWDWSDMLHYFTLKFATE